MPALLRKKIRPAQFGPFFAQDPWEVTRPSGLILKDVAEDVAVKEKICDEVLANPWQPFMRSCLIVARSSGGDGTSDLIEVSL
jgi:hypothetical protein